MGDRRHLCIGKHGRERGADVHQGIAQWRPESVDLFTDNLAWPLNPRLCDGKEVSLPSSQNCLAQRFHQQVFLLCDGARASQQLYQTN